VMFLLHSPQKIYPQKQPHTNQPCRLFLSILSPYSLKSDDQNRVYGPSQPTAICLAQGNPYARKETHPHKISEIVLLLPRLRDATSASHRLLRPSHRAPACPAAPCCLLLQRSRSSRRKHGRRHQGLADDLGMVDVLGMVI
jgi:hypothetical protein